MILQNEVCDGHESEGDEDCNNNVHVPTICHPCRIFYGDFKMDVTAEFSEKDDDN